VRRGGGLSTSISPRTVGFIGDTVNEIIARICRLIERAIGKEVHLIFAQDWHLPDDDEFEIWGQHCVRETPGGRGNRCVLASCKRSTCNKKAEI
jgi:nicotinamidase-related amidase